MLARQDEVVEAVFRFWSSCLVADYQLNNRFCLSVHPFLRPLVCLLVSPLVCPLRLKSRFEDTVCVCVCVWRGACDDFVTPRCWLYLSVMLGLLKLIGQCPNEQTIRALNDK